MTVKQMTGALTLLALALGSLASATDFRARPSGKDIETAVQGALTSLSTGDVKFNLVAGSGPILRVGTVPAFNPDVASRSFTRDGQQIVEFNPRGPLPLAQAVKAEVTRLLGLSTGTSAKDVKSRYGGADFNADGKVDLADFAILSASYGKTGSGLRGDLNNDGKVDGNDLKAFARFYPLP